MFFGLRNMRKLLLIFLLLPFSVLSEACNRFEYGTLSIHTVVVEKEIEGVSTAVHKNLLISWEAGVEIKNWYNNKSLTGKEGKPLKQFFGIQAVSATAILNSLGLIGWEAFSHVVTVQDYPQSGREWQLKRCL